jgi:transcriptional regulator with XRE-family HTH domain
MHEPLHLYVRRLRERRGRWLSQRRLAALAGLAPSTVLRLELGTRVPSERTLRAVARHLGTTEDDLLRRAGYRSTREETRAPPEVDVALALRELLASGPWPPALADALQTVLALTRDDSRALWEHRFDAAVAELQAEQQETEALAGAREPEEEPMFGVAWAPTTAEERAELLRVTRTPTPAQWLELRDKLFGPTVPRQKSRRPDKVGNNIPY